MAQHKLCVDPRIEQGNHSSLHLRAIGTCVPGRRLFYLCKSKQLVRTSTVCSTFYIYYMHNKQEVVHTRVLIVCRCERGANENLSSSSM